MTTFLLKLNCELHLGGADPRPRDASQWEGIRLRFPVPKLITGGVGRPVQDGDELVVWTHEDPQYGFGAGLTARGVATQTVTEETDVFATIVNVELLSPHFKLRGWSGGSSGSSVIDHILSHRHFRAYELEDEELNEFWRVVSEFMAKKRSLLATTAYMSDEERALAIDQPAVLAGFERRYSRREARPDQATFRKVLMRIYGGRCLVTGCATAEVLQAAHIIPFSEGIRLRDDPRNGLLLRADVHILFDKLLLAIHPRTGRIHLAPTLPGTAYKSLEGRRIHHQASSEFLREQYLLCKASWASEADG